MNLQDISITYPSPAIGTSRAQGADPALAATVQILVAFAQNNHCVANDLPHLFNILYAEVSKVFPHADRACAMRPPQGSQPVSVEESVAPDHLVCLEDGARVKNLKLHLKRRYNLTPDDYRRRWGLAADYPMVAPNLSKARSDNAKRTRPHIARKTGRQPEMMHAT